MIRLGIRAIMQRTFVQIIAFSTIAIFLSTALRAAERSEISVHSLKRTLLPGTGILLGITRIEEAASALNRKFSDPIEVTLKAGIEPRYQTPEHCRALLDLGDRINGTHPMGDWNILMQRLVDCQALQWLVHATVPSKTAMPQDLSSVHETRFWPASVWPAVSPEEMEALSVPGKTLQSASGRSYWQELGDGKQNIHGLVLSAHNYTVRVQWLARGDFDGDGWEDWLLRWQAQSEGGTWRSSRCLLLTRQVPGVGFAIRISGASR